MTACVGVGRVVFLGVGAVALVLTGLDELVAGAALGLFEDVQPASSTPSEAARSTRRRMQPPSHTRLVRTDGYPETGRPVLE
ncbi:MAG: hypothetical protein ABI808_07195 [Pseudonocardiales bacterium]